MYDATNTSTPSKRRIVYATDGAYDNIRIAEPISKHGKQTPTPLSGFQKDHHRKSTPSAPKKAVRSMMVLYMSLNKWINSSVLRLLVPSRNTILRPSTNLPRKEEFMSLILLIMNHPHQRIPFLRTNQTLSSLRMYLN